MMLRFALALTCTFYLWAHVFAASSVAAAGSPRIEWTLKSSELGDLPAPTASGNSQTASLVLDVDGDGVDDFVVTDRSTTPSVVWYKFNGSGWDLRVIDDASLDIEAGGAVHDIDADGDLDILFGNDSSGNRIWWWENPAPDFSANWVRRLVKDSGSNKHHDQVFADVDHDGAVELVSWNQGGTDKLLLFEIPADPRNTEPWVSEIIYSAGGGSYEGLSFTDIDLDGLGDLVGAGSWWKHLGNKVFEENVIDAGMTFTRVAAGQLVAGGRPEVVFAPGDADGAVEWYEWDGGSWVATTLLAFVTHGHSIDIRDVDGDGHADVFLGEMGSPGAGDAARTMIFFGDGAGNFVEETANVGQGIHEGRLADLDGDGQLDILVKPHAHNAPRIDVLLGSGTVLPLDRWQRHVIDEAKPYRAIFITAADVDLDGRDDLITGGWWYRNPGVLAESWPRSDLGTDLKNMATVFDFDRDGDPDVLGTGGIGSSPDDTFYWARNDGGGFTEFDNIDPGDGDFLQGVAVGRYVGSEDEVVLSWHQAGRGIQALTVPSNPAATTWSWRQAHPDSQDEALSSADIDGDGDLDLFLGTEWLRNEGGDVWTSFSISAVGGTPDRNRLIDVDGDLDLDAVVGFEESPSDLLWLEAPDDPTQSWTEHLIASNVGGGYSLDVGDIDRDGDADVVLGEHKGATRLLLFENLGSDAWNQIVIDDQSTDHHDGARLHDIDGDGDLDVLSIGWFHDQVLLYENRALGSPDDIPPTQPENLRADNVRHSSIELSWDPSNDENGIADYRVLQDGVEVLTTPRPSTTVGGLAPLTRYTFTVSARDPSGNESPPSDPLEVTTGSQPPAPRPVAHWALDELGGLTATDGEGGHDGVLSGMDGSEWASGLLGGGLDFDGVDDSVEIPSFEVPGSELSISAWLKADGFDHLGSRDGRILSKAAGVGEQDHTWMLSTLASGAETRLRFRLRTDGDTATLIAATGDVPVGSWVHTAAVYDGTAMRLYLDGSEVGSLAKSGIIGTGSDIALGNQPAGADSRPFDGLLDDICVFDAALTAEDIGALYNDGDGFSCGNLGAPTLELSGTCPGAITLTASGLTPNGATAILWSAGEGPGVVPGGPCVGTALELASPSLLLTTVADPAGEITIQRTVGAAACGLFLQVVDGTSCGTTGAGSLP